MGICDICNSKTPRTYVTWDSERGWYGRCYECRLVPILTDSGRLVLVEGKGLVEAGGTA